MSVTVQAIDLGKIRFYHPPPPSLPARPTKRTSPYHRQITPPAPSRDPVPLLDSSSSHAPPPTLSQSALHFPLPPRPPVIVPSSPARTGANSTPSSTASVLDAPSGPVNDFDRAIQEFVDTSIQYDTECDGNQGDALIFPSIQGGDHSHSSATTLNEERQNPLTAPLSSPTSKAPVEPPSQDTTLQLQSRTCISDVSPTAPRDSSPALSICTAPTPVPVFADCDTADSATRSSTEGTSATDLDRRCQSPASNIVHDHELESGGGSHPRSARAHSQRTSVELKRSTTRSSREPTTTHPDFLACNSSPPPPLVVIPVPFHADSSQPRHEVMSAHRLASRDHSIRSSPVCEDDKDLDTFPSDDENDSDYIDPTDTEEGDNPRPAKRRRSTPLDEFSKTSSSRDTQMSSVCTQSESPRSSQQTPSVESESIPVQGFLKLRHHGSEVIYCLELSQTHFSSLFAAGQTDTSLPTRHTGYSTQKRRFTPEEDAFIIELKGKGLVWAEIEEQFAQRFPRRKKSSLEVRYCNKLKPSRKRR